MSKAAPSLLTSSIYLIGQIVESSQISYTFNYIHICLAELIYIFLTEISTETAQWIKWKYRITVSYAVKARLWRIILYLYVEFFRLCDQWSCLSLKGIESCPRLPSPPSPTSCYSPFPFICPWLSRLWNGGDKLNLLFWWSTTLVTWPLDSLSFVIRNTVCDNNHIKQLINSSQGEYWRRTLFVCAHVHTVYS